MQRRRAALLEVERHHRRCPRPRKNRPCHLGRRTCELAERSIAVRNSAEGNVDDGVATVSVDDVEKDADIDSVVTVQPQRTELRGTTGKHPTERLTHRGGRGMKQREQWPRGERGDATLLDRAFVGDPGDESLRQLHPRIVDERHEQIPQTPCAQAGEIGVDESDEIGVTFLHPGPYRITFAATRRQVPRVARRRDDPCPGALGDSRRVVIGVIVDDDDVVDESVLLDERAPETPHNRAHGRRFVACRNADRDRGTPLHCIDPRRKLHNIRPRDRHDVSPIRHENTGEMPRNAARDLRHWHTGGMNSHILFIEDDTDIRQVISTALRDDGFSMSEATTGEEGLAMLESAPCDLALIDLRLPGMNGISVVREMRRATAIPLVILTAHGDSHDVVAALEAGADDFLNKPIGTKELSARLRAILRRTSLIPDKDEPSELRLGSLVILPATHQVFVDDSEVGFTRTEYLVLLELISRAPSTVSRMDLLERVWGYDYLGDSRLVDMQIYRIRAKLEPFGLKDKLATVRGVGFKLTA